MRLSFVLFCIACGPPPATEVPPPSAPIVVEARSQAAPAQSLPQRAQPQGTIVGADDCSDEAAQRCSANGGHCHLVANNGCAGRGAVCQNLSTQTIGCVCHCDEVGPNGEVYLPM